MTTRSNSLQKRHPNHTLNNTLYPALAHNVLSISTKVFVTMALLGSVTLPAAATLEDIATTHDMPSSQDSVNGIIALVNETPILKSELNQEVADMQARIAASGQTIPEQQRLRNEVLNSLILRKLQLSMIDRAGIRPEANVVHQQLTRVAQSQGLNSLAQLQQAMDLEKPGSYARLRARIIEEESLRVLQQNQIARRVRITNQDIEAFLSSPEAQRLERIEYRTIHIRVPFAGDYDQLSDAQKEQTLAIAKRAQQLLTTTDDAQAILQQLTDNIANNYPVQVQGGDMGYHEASGLPVELASKITPLEIGQVTEPQITPQGIDVIKLVDKRGNDQLIIPQWKVRHILIKADDSMSTDIAEQQINDIYEQLRADADFSALASTYSNDPGSAGRGGDLDWVSEGQMVSEFEEMMKRTPVGDFSTPFKSQFGWHILKVEDSRQQDVSSTVKYNLARETLFKRLAPQAQEDWLQELKANAYIKIFE